MLPAGPKTAGPDPVGQAMHGGEEALTLHEVLVVIHPAKRLLRHQALHLEVVRCLQPVLPEHLLQTKRERETEEGEPRHLRLPIPKRDPHRQANKQSAAIVREEPDRHPASRHGEEQVFGDIQEEVDPCGQDPGHPAA